MDPDGWDLQISGWRSSGHRTIGDSTHPHELGDPMARGDPMAVPSFRNLRTLDETTEPSEREHANRWLGVADAPTASGCTRVRAVVRPAERVGAAPHLAAARSVPSRGGVIITRAPKSPAVGSP